MSKLLKLTRNYEILVMNAGEKDETKITINKLVDALEFLREKIDEYKLYEDEEPKELIKQYKHIENMIETHLSKLMVN